MKYRIERSFDDSGIDVRFSTGGVFHLDWNDVGDFITRIMAFATARQLIDAAENANKRDDNR